MKQAGRKPKVPIQVTGPISIKVIRQLLDQGYLPILVSYLKYPQGWE